MTIEEKCEDDIWKKIKQNIGRKGHFSRIESPVMAPGFPDINYCFYGIEGTLELKYGRDECPEIRPTQVRWINNRIQHGGRVWILVLIVLAGVKNYYLVRGNHARALAEAHQYNDIRIYRSLATEIWRGSINWGTLLQRITD